jgi:hypothetical protein
LGFVVMILCVHGLASLFLWLLGCSSAATLGRRRDRGSKGQADCSAPWNKWGETVYAAKGRRIGLIRARAAPLALAASAARDAARRQAENERAPAGENKAAPPAKIY